MVIEDEVVKTKIDVQVVSVNAAEDEESDGDGDVRSQEGALVNEGGKILSINFGGANAPKSLLCIFLIDTIRCGRWRD
jgi:hypothetical protein